MWSISLRSEVLICWLYTVYTDLFLENVRAQSAPNKKKALWHQLNIRSAVESPRPTVSSSEGFRAAIHVRVQSEVQAELLAYVCKLKLSSRTTDGWLWLCCAACTGKISGFSHHWSFAVLFPRKKTWGHFPLKWPALLVFFKFVGRL